MARRGKKRNKKSRRRGARYIVDENGPRGHAYGWKEAMRKQRKYNKSNGYRFFMPMRGNPPISASDLKVLRRILAVHERDNRSRSGKGKKRGNPYYTSPARYAKMSTKARAKYRAATRRSRMHR